MKQQQKRLINLIYIYISTAFILIMADVFELFHPAPGIIAGLCLLSACYLIGKLSKSL